MLEELVERIRKVIEKEREEDWAGQAIRGGFRTFQEIWEADALKAGLDASWVRQIGESLKRYDLADPRERAQLANQILGLLDRSGGPDPNLRNIDRIGEAAPTAAQASAAPSAPVPPPQPTHLAASSTAGSPSAGEKQSVLHDEVESLRGIGPATAQRLARLGIETVADLIWHLPHRHDDYSQVRTVAEMLPGEQISLVANLWKVEERKLSMKRHMVQGIFNDGTGTLRATWWSKWKTKELKEGKTYRLMGKVDLFMGQKVLNNPEIERIKPRALQKGLIQPVYPLTEGLTSSNLSRLIQKALNKALSAIEDPVPAEIRQRFDLMDLPTALQQIHSPESMEQLEAARQRFAFDELFSIQLGVQRRRHLLQQTTAPALAFNAEVLDRFKEALPFELTGAQQRVLQEIALDVARTIPMSRLVQGDVGSGKTVVAAGAMYVAAVNGAQSAMLAPTQILAEQHYRGLSQLLGTLTKPRGTPLNVALLTGRVTGSERDDVLDGLADGSIDVVVGTTALIQDGVAFHNLAFVVVDEQHRFGVEQRSTLRSKGDDGAEALVPHMLVMSATPIPRSLALTIYGDLDVSVIDELPPGRQEIKTKLFHPTERERLYGFLRRQVQQGRQGYIIYPLVEESEKLDVGAAVDEYERLRTEIFPDLRLGLLHGRLSGAEKDEVMQQFADGAIDVLVSTSVIEVGIDVPNATIMYIEDAERFGLAQLHQFRGRVGRGEHQSYCALISRTDSATAEERLNALCETTDGFKLAEKDLELRGPGEFLGTRQSGLPGLQMAKLSDTETLSLAQQAAKLLFEQDPELAHHPLLRAKVERFWRGHGDVN